MATDLNGAASSAGQGEVDQIRPITDDTRLPMILVDGMRARSLHGLNLKPSLPMIDA
jgi:hypothetical protein